MIGKPGNTETAQTREERLAAKLRENLHRRKAQARALSAPSPQDENESGRLSKSPPES